MSTSQRVSRGFHRLGIFLAIIILLIGVPYWLFQGLGSTGYYWRQNEALVCAHDLLQRDPKRFWDLNHFQPEEVNHRSKGARLFGPLRGTRTHQGAGRFR